MGQAVCVGIGTVMFVRRHQHFPWFRLLAALTLVWLGLVGGYAMGRWHAGTDARAAYQEHLLRRAARGGP